MDAEYFAGFFDTDGSIHSGLAMKPTGRLKIQSDATFGISAKYLAGMFDGDGTVRTLLQEKVNSMGLDSKVLIGQAMQGPLFIILQGLRDSGFPFRFRVRREKGRVDHADIFLTDKNSIRSFLEHIRLFTVIKREQIDFWLDEIYPKYKPNAGRARNSNGQFNSSGRTKQELIELAEVCLKLSSMKQTLRAGKLKWTPERVEQWCIDRGVE